ncbi:unnamed protein product [marine sediment metagenome]|uniref:Uncharacterized protein n=1 Tax=marine sediment metagenome TaxID=412755 RepID=X0RM15_9ZZZZ
MALQRQHRRIRLGTLRETPAEHPGAISGEDYLQRAKELDRKRQELNRQAGILRAQYGRSIRPECAIDADCELNKHMLDLQHRMSSGETQTIWTVGEGVSHRPKPGPRLVDTPEALPGWQPGDPGYNGETPEEIYARADCSDIASRDSDADLIIYNVHKLPQRQKMRPAPDDMQISCSAAMLVQQETGRYPTLEDHLEGRSPMYAVRQGEFGNLITELVEADERTRLNHMFGPTEETSGVTSRRMT